MTTPHDSTTKSPEQGLDRPNYTQVPNVILDDLMKELSEAELRVLMTACRQTFGYHESKAEMSLTFLMKATGLSRQGVLNGIEGLKGRGLMIDTGDSGAHGAKVYSLKIKRSTTLTSQSSRPEVVNVVDRSLVNEVDPIKKQVNKEEIAGSKEPRQPDPIFDAVALRIFGMVDSASVKAQGAGGRIAKISVWVKKNYPLAVPEDFLRFANWCLGEKGFNAPRDLPKFSEHWIAFTQTKRLLANIPQRQNSIPAIEEVPEQRTPEELEEIRRLMEKSSTDGR